MLNTFLYAVTDEHIVYRVKVVKFIPRENITRIHTSIDLEVETDSPYSITDHHLDHFISFTFRNNVSENLGIFDNKEAAIKYALTKIDEELEGIAQQQKELNEIRELYTLK